MQISIDQLLNGKATRIGKRNYFPTAAYVEPFIERMSKFTKDFIVEVELPKQVTRTVDEDVNADDITYNRVLIQAVMPENCRIDNHDEVIGMVYGLDVRKPVAKIYRGALNRACTNLCVFDPEFLQVQNLESEKPINYKAVEHLLSQTSDIKLMLDTLHNTTWEGTPSNIDSNLGRWVRNAISMTYNGGYGDVKIGTDLVVKAYGFMFEDPDSSYYIGEGNEVDMFTVYNAFTQLISNDKGKDLMNRAEKTLLLRNILNF